MTDLVQVVADDPGHIAHTNRIHQLLRGNPWFNVRGHPYNAVGDGVADDTAEVQAAIDAAFAAGGGVVIGSPDDTYLVRKGANTYCLDLKSNVYLVGLHLKNDEQGGTPPNVVRGLNADNVRVIDCFIEGDAEVGDLADQADGYGVHLAGVTNFQIRGCRFEYLRQGPFQVGNQAGGGGNCQYGLISDLHITGLRMNLGWIATATDVAVRGIVGQSSEGITVENGPCTRITLSDLLLVHDESVTPLAFGYAAQVVANNDEMKQITYSNLRTIGGWVSGFRAIADGFDISDLSLSDFFVEGQVKTQSLITFGTAGGASLTNALGSNLIARDSAFASGFSFDGDVEALMVNCVAIENHQQGFYVGNGADVEFVNCLAKDNNQQGLAGNSGFYVQHASVARLVNCRSTGASQTYGLNVVSAAAIASLIHCRLGGNGSAPYSNAGTFEQLLLDDGYLIAHPSNPGTEVLLGNVGGTATVRLGGDVNLYRAGANLAKTDDKFVAALGIGVGNSVVATTPGSVVRKIEVFDADGASLGFIPVYSAIT